MGGLKPGLMCARLRLQLMTDVAISSIGSKETCHSRIADSQSPTAAGERLTRRPEGDGA